MVGADPVAIDTVCLKLCQVKRRLFKGEDWPISPPPDNITAADKTYNLGNQRPGAGSSSSSWVGIRTY